MTSHVIDQPHQCRSLFTAGWRGGAAAAGARRHLHAQPAAATRRPRRGGAPRLGPLGGEGTPDPIHLIHLIHLIHPEMYGGEAATAPLSSSENEARQQLLTWGKVAAYLHIDLG